MNPSWARLVAPIRITENEKCGSFIGQTNNMETKDLKKKANNPTAVQIFKFKFNSLYINLI